MVPSPRPDGGHADGPRFGAIALGSTDSAPSPQVAAQLNRDEVAKQDGFAPGVKELAQTPRAKARLTASERAPAHTNMPIKLTTVARIGQCIER